MLKNGTIGYVRKALKQFRPEVTDLDAEKVIHNARWGDYQAMVRHYGADEATAKMIAMEICAREEPYNNAMELITKY